MLVQDRIRLLRAKLGLTQARLASFMGVSGITVNRWENGASKPSALALEKIESAEKYGLDGLETTRRPPLPAIVPEAESSLAVLDFGGDPEDLRLIVEAERLSFGHQSNPAFAIETSLIDALPHQRIAVYQHMMKQPRLRFLLADDAGAGKTIMTGLYLREMIARRLVRRVLVVPPAGLVGNWESELRRLFNLNFNLVVGADARNANPFVGPDSDWVIVSVDTLAGDRMFARLQDTIVKPYDLVIFDESHKLAARRDPDGTFRATDRYRLAEALAGVRGLESRWLLGWSAHHILLLTATPHMGKDFPYYCLWRLLEPQLLSTENAFEVFPQEERSKRFIRRMKEEMVYYDGRPIYPQRLSDTLSYELSRGEEGEWRLYEETTKYIENYYNQARILNRSAARFAVGVFQRRIASSTWALLCSLRKRLQKVDRLIEALRSGELSEDELRRRQLKLDRCAHDLLDDTTADEETSEGGIEDHERAEDELLGGVIATSLAQLIVEREKVDGLVLLAERVDDRGEESKFTKLREVLRASQFANEKAIIFTEHRDTQDFLVRRFEGLGLTGRIARIHGGMGFKERGAQVEYFRKPASAGGAQYLICTDAAGEGINLQFAWLMINYDIPWNPARLEQRMGRIHRYGQKRDPVIVLNLVAAGTREGRVMRVILEKMERVRKELGSDKVFDVIGRLFEGVSLREYMERAVIDDATLAELDGKLTKEQVEALEEVQRRIYGEGGDVRSQLVDLNAVLASEETRRLLPGYVMRFLQKSAPRLGLNIDGDLQREFSLRAFKPGAMDRILPLLEQYEAAARDRFTVYRPDRDRKAIFLRPSEPIFERLRRAVRAELGISARRGAVFIDPTVTEPYLFHVALVTIVRKASDDAIGLGETEVLEQRLVGVRQNTKGACELDAVEQLLVLRPELDSVSGAGATLIGFAPKHLEGAAIFAREQVARTMVEEKRAAAELMADSRRDFLARGFDFREAELAAARSDYAGKARLGDARSRLELERIRDQQRDVSQQRELAFSELTRESELISVGEIQFLAHAIVVPSSRPEDRRHRDDAIEAIAVQLAIAHEASRGAIAIDVSTPAAARAAGLTDFPGFDLLSRHPNGEERFIEVKGRAKVGEVLVSDNEWAKAVNHRDKYWLYVVFDCASPAPRLHRVKDPFSELLVKAIGGVGIDATEIYRAATSGS